MSSICSTILILLLVSASLALRAPPMVYSGMVKNAQSAPLQCSVVWSEPSKPPLQSGLFTIEENSYYTVRPKEFTTSEGWVGRAELTEIHCGGLELKSPFANVNSPVENWIFSVEDNQIVSVGPSSKDGDN